MEMIILILLDTQLIYIAAILHVYCLLTHRSEIMIEFIYCILQSMPSSSKCIPLSLLGLSSSYIHR